MAGGSTRNWTGVLYLEDLPDNWQDISYLEMKLQVPYAYCVHDKDLDKDGDCRKPHVHFIIAYPNTTTYNNAKKVLERLFNGNGHNLHKIEEVISIRMLYNYLIHDTDGARSDGKYQYSPDERKTGNGFDIGFLEQMEAADKEDLIYEAESFIWENHIRRYGTFIKWARGNFTGPQVAVLRGCVSHFRALCDSEYQSYQEKKEKEQEAMKHAGG